MAFLNQLICLISMTLLVSVYPNLSLGADRCVDLFQATPKVSRIKVTGTAIEPSHLEKFLASGQDVNIRARVLRRVQKNSQPQLDHIDYWSSIASQFLHSNDSYLYRGISPTISEFLSILKEGMQAHKTELNENHLSSDLKLSMGYMFSNLARLSENEPRLSVLYVVKRSSDDQQLRAGRPGYVAGDIAPERISQILIFDPKSESTTFPFIVIDLR